MYLLFMLWAVGVGFAVWRPRWATPFGLGVLAVTAVWAAIA